MPIREGAAAALLAALLAAGCTGDADPLGPDSATVNGLRVSIAVDPATIERQETLTATLRIENLRDEPVLLTASCTAVALIQAYRGDRLVALEGTSGGCFTAITYFDFDPLETRAWSFEILAVRTDGAPVEKGTYRLEADLQVPDLPDLKTSFEVN